jgi:hypothetical protein
VAKKKKIEFRRGQPEANDLLRENYEIVKKDTRETGLVMENSETWEIIHEVLQEADFGSKATIGHNGQYALVALKIDEASYIIFNPTRSHILCEGFQCPSHVAMSHPVNIVDGVEVETLFIPTLEDIQNGILLDYPDIYDTKHRLKYADERDRSCFCPTNELSFVMPGRMASMCLSRKLFTSSGIDAQLECKTFSLNTTKVYRNCNANPMGKRLKLLVPMPFLNNLLWEERIFVPSNHSQELSKEIRFISGLSATFYRESISKYCIADPKYQTELVPHPQGGEPNPTSELYWHVQNLYGVETLSRVHSTLHPTVYPRHISLLNMKEDLEAEIIDQEQPHTVEDFLLSKHSEFLTGKGQITCSLCIPEMLEHGKIFIRRYNRKSFISHYRKNHLQAALFMGCAFESGLASRILEVYTLYNYAVCMRAYRIEKVNPPHFDLPIESYDGIQKALKIKKKPNPRDAEYFTTEYSTDDSDRETDNRRNSAPRPAVPKVPQMRKQIRTHYTPESDYEINESGEEHAPKEPVDHSSAKPGGSREKIYSEKKDSKGAMEGEKKIRNSKEKIEEETKKVKNRHVTKDKKAEGRPVQNMENSIDENTGQQNAISQPVEMDIEEDISPLQVMPVPQIQQGSENETNVYDLLDEPFETSEITADDVNILDPERLENLLMNEAISQPQRPRASSSRRSARKE